MHWPVSTIAVLDDAAAAARAGTPTALGIVGRAGFGKSTLLRAAAARLDGFHALRAYGEEGGQDDRFQLLSAWHGEQAPRHTRQATRLLSEVVDTRQLTGPVALVVDDLQWVDPESVETLTTLVERAAGDRLLILAAHRPLGTRHPGWRRLGALTVRLDGLDVDAAASLVASLAPDAPPALAEALRVHTGGSPLHMRALLQEHSAPELVSLAARGDLPAPADLAAAVEARLADLAPDAGRLLRALAVLGDTWTDLATAAAIGEVSDAEAAIGVLADEELLRIDRTPAVPRVRIVHAVLRAAAYETIPVVARRRLHGAAAARLTGRGDRLRHRLAAAVGPDSGLAADLDRHADDRHERGLFREAARFRRLAAGATAAAPERERRLLDADIDALIARDRDQVSVVDLDEDASAHRRFVYALWLCGTWQWWQAARVLDHVDPGELDPVNAHRFLVLRAWTIFGSGRPPAEALPVLQAAATATVQDGIFRWLFVMTYGQVTAAMAGRDDPVWGFDELGGTDRAALRTSLAELARLSWRGTVFAVTGATAVAVDDLTVVTKRMDDGAMDLGDGVCHAFLGYAQWCRGDWRRASISIGLAQAANPHVPLHPVVAAIAPLAALVTGDDPAPSLARSREARLGGPIPGAIYTGDVAEIAVLAFIGTPGERRTWRQRRSADFGTPVPPTGRAPLLWLLAMGIGASWAGDADATETWADALADRPETGWRDNAVAWLRALARMARGENPTLEVLARTGLPGLEAFAALLWVDAAAADPEARTQAKAALAGIDAGRYAATLLSETSAPDDPLAALSDRERDVATLLLEGLSYAQIAKELFVTRSTVAFHLSNVYAKTGTASRHEFVQMLRRTQG